MMGIQLQSLGLAALVILTWQLQLASSDTLFIEKIKCLRTATGLDDDTKFAISASLASASLVNANSRAAQWGLMGGPAVSPLGMAFSKSAVLELMDKEQTPLLALIDDSSDDLFILVNGVKVFPKGENDYKEMEQGSIVQPNIEFDSGDPFTIQLVEYDSTSSHDLLGQFSVLKDFKGVKSCKIDKCTSYLVSGREGSVYEVTWRVERNNNGKGVQKWLQTGTSTYKECNEIMCRKTNDDEVDRDKDKEKTKKMKDDDDWLLECPPGFQQRGFKEYPQIWPWPNVFLRICSSKLEECELSSDAAAEYKCKQVAEEMNLKTTGFKEGSKFWPFASKDYNRQGCFYNNEGKYKGYAWFGKGGKAAHWAGLGENTEGWGVQMIPLCRRIEYCPEASLSDPKAEELCKAIAGQELGKTLGSKKDAFASEDYKTKGCFVYKSGQYAGQAYFGRGGTVTDWGKTNEYKEYEMVPLCTFSEYEFEEDDD